MGSTVSRSAERRAGQGWQADAFSLYGSTGGRKYLNQAERQRALEVMQELERGRALFALTLAWTGARVSEVLALTPSSLQVESSIVAVDTLKRRRPVMREVPIPPELMQALDAHFRILAAQRVPHLASRRLWPWSRVTAWRLIKSVMCAAGVVGIHACPRGLRHAFGVATLGIVPANIRQKWMGHARPQTTDIYSAVCGSDEIEFAARFWNSESGGSGARVIIA